MITKIDGSGWAVQCQIPAAPSPIPPTSAADNPNRKEQLPTCFYTFKIVYSCSLSRKGPAPRVSFLGKGEGEKKREGEREGDREGDRETHTERSRERSVIFISLENSGV